MIILGYGQSLHDLAARLKKPLKLPEQYSSANFNVQVKTDPAGSLCRAVEYQQAHSKPGGSECEIRSPCLGIDRRTFISVRCQADAHPWNPPAKVP